MLANFLTKQRNQHHWQPSILRLARSAITQMHPVPSTVSNSALLNELVTSWTRQQSPARVHHKAVSLQPALCPGSLFGVMCRHPHYSASATHLFHQQNGHSLVAGTISKWLRRYFIDKVTSESTTLRSLASSAALDKNIAKDDIVALGNWSQSLAFDHHYHRNYMLQVNFASAILSATEVSVLDISNDEAGFVDVVDSLDQQ